MATIKQIDSRSVHQIQSGQVIVDLCSVAKELVENSIDSGATTIDVRFKNQGLDAIEVQDNGSGIAPSNYDFIALKHHTSKLSSYADIDSLQTFGFRGEALASLCALSTLCITTCLAADAPKGTKLSFEPSGKLKDTSMVAAQRGTTVAVQQLFHNLPVRRRELERNIKREWQKVIALLNQYACIQTGLKFSVSQQPTKGKRILLFSTQGNDATRGNIMNIFGTKTLNALVPIELPLEMRASSLARPTDASADRASRAVRVVGHVSRPLHGSGRQTPDRQMFFVNGRPCGLPQFAKAFNEVYRSYNMTQAPFILADIQLDTDMYDVNVSPDKRSILLHDQTHLLESLREALTNVFDTYDGLVPTSQHPVTRAPSKETALEVPSAFKKRIEERSPSTRASSYPISTTGDNAQDAEKDDSSSDSESGIDSDNDDAHVQAPKRTALRMTTSRVVVKEGYNQDLISRWIVRKDPSPLAAAPHDARSRSPESVPMSGMAFQPTRQGDVASEASSDLAAVDSANASHPSRADDDQPGDADVGTLSPKGSSQRIRRVAKGPASDVIVSIGGHVGSEVGESSEEERSNPVDHDRTEVEPRASFGKHLSSLFSASNGATQSPVSSARGTLSRAREPDSDAEMEVETEDEEKDDKDEDQGDEAGDNTDVNDDTQDNQGVGNPIRSASRHASEAAGLSNVQPSKQRTASLPLAPAESTETEAETPPEGEPDAEIIPSPSRNTPQKGSTRRKDATLSLLQTMHTTTSSLGGLMNQWADALPSSESQHAGDARVEDLSAPDAEAKLPLIISKHDFDKMNIVGQFNLGFIIAVRSGKSSSDTQGTADELFIIDQHASDEKYNFERLQANTVIQSQRLVHSKRLDLTALEEEVIMQSLPAIEANGFKVHVDTSGDWPVGARVELLALPLSRETTFSLSDFEELVALLADESSESLHVPRPSKVRKVFAMRACRSSIMIGKALSQTQMQMVVRHMSGLDKPWNCPHGRPTMRHLCQLDVGEEKRWKDDVTSVGMDAWRSFM